MKQGQVIIFNKDDMQLIHQACQMVGHEKPNPKKRSNPLSNNEEINLSSTIVKVVESFIQMQKKASSLPKSGNQIITVTNAIQCFLDHSQEEARKCIDLLEGELKMNLLMFMNKYFHSCINMQRQLKLPFYSYIDTISKSASTSQSINAKYSNLTSNQQEYFFLFNKEILRIKNEMVRSIKLKTQVKAPQMQCSNCSQLQLKLARCQQTQRNSKEKLKNYNSVLKKNEQSQNEIMSLKIKLSELNDASQAKIKHMQKILQELRKDKSDTLERERQAKLQRDSVNLKNTTLQKENSVLSNRLRQIDSEISNVDAINTLKADLKILKRQGQTQDNLIRMLKEQNKSLSSQLESLKQEVQQTKKTFNSIQMERKQERVEDIEDKNQLNEMKQTAQIKALVDENQRLKQTIESKRIIYQQIMQDNQVNIKQLCSKNVELQLKLLNLEQALKRISSHSQTQFRNKQLKCSQPADEFRQQLDHKCKSVDLEK